MKLGASGHAAAPTKLRREVFLTQTDRLPVSEKNFLILPFLFSLLFSLALTVPFRL